MNKILTLLLLIGLPIILWPDDSLIVVADKTDWLPLLYRNKGDDLGGPLGEITRLILERAGFDYDIRLYPWKRAIDQVRKGSAHILVAGYNSRERERSFYVTPPLFNLRRGFFYSTKKYPQGPPLQIWEDLKDFNILGIKGFVYGKRYDEEKLIDYMVDNGGQALTMLKEGRADLFLTNLDQIYGHPLFFSMIEDGSIAYLLRPFEPAKGFHLFITRKSSLSNQIYKRVSDTILTLEDQGVFQSVMEKHMPGIYR